VVAGAGLRSVLSSPLQAGEETIGALNLYSRDPDGFDANQQRLAAEFARHASILLANAITFMQATELAQNLVDALNSREIIGVAIGLVMAQPPARTRQRAFDVLRRVSQRENRKLRDIATELVARAEERATL
jgi:GAF domain-containing protein